MSVVFTDSFTVGANANIDAHPAGSPDYAYNLGSGSAITVNATTDRAERSGVGRAIARIIDAAVPTTNYEITTLTEFGSATTDIGFAIVRAATDGTDNCYQAIVFTTDANEVQIYRRVAGISTQIASRDNGFTGSGSYTARFRVTGTNPVSLTFQADATTALTFDDTDAGRHQSGPPGIGMRDDTVWVDDVSVDDLAVTGTMAVTLSAFTSAITGTTTVVGTMAAVMAAFTSAITGTPTVVGAMAAVLAAFTSAITATTSVVGTMAATLADFVSAISGTVGDAVASARWLLRQIGNNVRTACQYVVSGVRRNRNNG